MRNLFLACLFACLPFLLPAQIITVTPAFPTVDDTVTIVYDAAQGNAALVGVSPVYIHTGLITNLSTSGTDWKYVQMLPWVTNNPKLLMTSLGNNKHQIKYHIKSYYGITNPNETVQKLAFVFRNTAGTVVGKDANGSDIFYNVYSGTNLNLQFASPANGSIFNLNDNISISANVSAAANLTLSLNGTSVQTATNATNISYNTTATPAGQYWVKLTAVSGATTLTDSIYYIVQGNPPIQVPPTGTIFGVKELSPTSVRVCLNTPFPDKSWVYVVGDFNNWLPTPATQMKKTPDGRIWWVDITGLTAGQEYAYQFLIKNSGGNVMRLADPYCDKTLDPWNDSFILPSLYPNLKPYPTGKTTGIVSVFQTAQTPYNWQVTNFNRPKTTDLVVYELLIRDWSKRHSYQALMDSLWYLKNMNINAIELMPINEFEGNSSWGYNPSFQFAVDKYYGPKDKLKEFIDVCHQNGIAVILDIVLNHQFGLSPMVNMYWDAANNKPATNNPWFNPDAKHPFNVGYDMNHDATETRTYIDSVLRYWVREYKVDGFRFDLSKGFTQYNSGTNVGLWGQKDPSRIYNLKRMADQIRAVDPNQYLILEHFANNDEEKELADYNFLLWGNLNHAYNEATMGWIPNSNFDGISWKTRGWNKAHLVGYMESHDEERLMYKNLQFGNSNGSYNIKNLNTALDRMGMASTFLLTVPGPKMIWQFGELGYDYSIDFDCRTCEKPIRWDYFNVAQRNKLYLINAALNKLRIDENAFETTDFTMNVSGTVKQIQLNHSSMKVNVLGNFGVSTTNGTFNFQQTGKWYDFFTGDSIVVTNTSYPMTFEPGEYHLYTTKKLQTPNLTDIFEGENTADFALKTFPNPFTEELHFVYTPQQKDVLSLKIYNQMGQLVKLIETDKNVLNTQVYESVWDGKDLSGNSAAAGLYLYVLEGGFGVKSGKVWKN